MSASPAPDTAIDVASAFVVVDVKNAKAKYFYERHGFVSFSDDPLSMYIHMKTIDKLLADATAAQSCST